VLAAGQARFVHLACGDGIVHHQRRRAHGRNSSGIIVAEANLSPAVPRIGVVLVNWNRWADTVEALESLLRSDVPVTAIVVDNASADGSLDHIADWAAGRETAPVASADMAGFSKPPLPKPIALRRIAAADWPAARLAPEDRLVLVDSGGNLGFAGGNNIGLKLLLADPGIDIFWLLNNDTVVAPDTARRLAARMDATGAGMCGTVVRYYWNPDTVQAANGHRFNIWKGTARGIHQGLPAADLPDPALVEAQTSFILGASLAVSRAFLDKVGLMEDSYFLYFEEIDWAARNRKLPGGGFRVAYAPDAVVYHKEGGSIGSSGIPGARSLTADYWLAKSRLAYFRRHQPLLLPWHWGVTLGLAGLRVARGQPDKARVILKALFGG
jgi:GT2 family glycosyltransferase